MNVITNIIKAILDLGNKELKDITYVSDAIASVQYMKSAKEIAEFNKQISECIYQQLIVDDKLIEVSEVISIIQQSSYDLDTLELLDPVESEYSIFDVDYVDENLEFAAYDDNLGDNVRTYHQLSSTSFLPHSDLFIDLIQSIYVVNGEDKYS